MIQALTSSQSYKIQIIRGICISAVVLIHCLPVGLIQVFVRPFVNYAVATFLLLSGMLSNAERYKPWNRIKKILIPYILWTLIYSAINSYRSLGRLPAVFVKNLLTGKAAAIMYFVFVYCELTLLIPLIDRLAHTRYRLIGFLISPVEIILFRLLPVLGVYAKPRVLDILVGISCLGYFSFFYFGYLLGNKMISFKHSNTCLAVLLGLSIILQIAEGYLYYTLGETNCGTAMKLSALLTSLLFGLAAFRFIMWKESVQCQLFKTLGDYSFGVFFCHLAVKKVLGLFHLPSFFAAPLILAVLVLGISLLLVMIGRILLGKFGKYLAF